jgi:RNA polymerase sigma-70 factor (ECF subfamily)
MNGDNGLLFREADDKELVGKARRGDVEAYNCLVSRWEKRVYNYILRLTGHREDAMDLTQDTLFKAYQYLEKLDDPSRFAPWLYRIAHNETYSLLRRNRPDREEIVETGAGLQGRRMLPVETSLAVQSALDRLPGDQKEAVILKVYEGFKFEEIAGILGCPVSTIKSRVYAGLDTLKDMLAPVRLRGV